MVEKGAKMASKTKQEWGKDDQKLGKVRTTSQEERGMGRKNRGPGAPGGSEPDRELVRRWSCAGERFRSGVLVYAGRFADQPSQGGEVVEHVGQEE